jgi:phosphoglycerol transferase MdoB-like AlkP superfamily enzyme
MKPESPQKEKPTQQQVIDAIIFLADLTEKKLSPRPYGSLDIFPTEENTYTQLRP